MSNSEEHDNSADQSEPDDDLQDVLGQLDSVERRRKIRTAIVAVAVLLTVIAIFWWIGHHTEDFFRPNIDVEQGEQELLADTGDPVCRGMLAAIEEIHGDFAEREFDFEDGIWGDDEEQLDQLRETATAFRSRMDNISDDIDDAVFREEDISGHPPVPEQVGEWFDNMDNEFRILEEMADRRLRMIREEDLAERGGMWEDPENLRDTVLMTVNENFEEFRVWVSRGGHPCGAPPEGVEPWTPTQ